MEEHTKIEPTLLVVLLLCKQVCDSILQSIIEDGEIDELIEPFKKSLDESLMNGELHYISQNLVIANRSEALITAIAHSMDRIKGLMLQMASTIIPVTDKKLKEGHNAN